MRESVLKEEIKKYFINIRKEVLTQEISNYFNDVYDYAVKEEVKIRNMNKNK